MRQMQSAALSREVCSAVERRQFREALALYAALHRRFFPADGATFAATAAVKACARLPDPRVGAAIHAHASKLGLAPADPYLRTALVDLYARNGAPTAARNLLQQSPSCQTAVSHNALLSGLLRSGDLLSARRLFDEMPHRDAVSWNAMISACAKSGDMPGAAALLEKMPVADRNAESWNALISGYAARGELRLARKVFDEMPYRSFVSYVALIGGYARAGDVSAAEKLFKGMPPPRNAAAWNAMLACYAQNGRAGEALRLFLQMQKTHLGGEVLADGKTLVSVVSACAQLGEARLGRWAEAHLGAAGIPLDDHLRTALADLRAKCGDVDGAFQLFQGLGRRDVVSYSTMILACGSNGRLEAAVRLFEEMVAVEGILPNGVTFMGLLAAYAHAGQVAEGCRCFAAMAAEHGIQPGPEHWAALVDLLGRAGRVEEAHQVVETTPAATHSGAWGALLLACRLHGRLELGEAAARRYAELEPGSSAHLVTLAGIYAAAGRWDDAGALWATMQATGVPKIQACSWAHSTASLEEAV
ncbi:pentatricopeptide repeat-containing protein CRR2, chloroplastic-like [Wolffia australiana]